MPVFGIRQWTAFGMCHWPLTIDMLDLHERGE